MSNIDHQQALLNTLLCELITVDETRLPIEVYKAIQSVAVHHLSAEVYTVFRNNHNAKFYQAILDSQKISHRLTAIEIEDLKIMNKFDRPMHAGRWPLTRAEWKRMSSDYKGIIDGQHYALRLIVNKGTCSVPVEFLD